MSVIFLFGDWGERCVLVNGGFSSSKWLPQSEPIEVNNVNMAIATAYKRSNRAVLGLFKKLFMQNVVKRVISLSFSAANRNACFEFRHFRIT